MNAREMFEDAVINFRIVILYPWLLKKLVWRISYNLPENCYIFCHLMNHNLPGGVWIWSCDSSLYGSRLAWGCPSVSTDASPLIILKKRTKRWSCLRPSRDCQPSSCNISETLALRLKLFETNRAALRWTFSILSLLLFCVGAKQSSYILMQA